MEGEPIPIVPPRRRRGKRLLEIHESISNYLEKGDGINPSSRERLFRIQTRIEGDLWPQHAQDASSTRVRAEIRALKLEARSI